MRLPDWPARLDALIAAASGRRFRYGVFDCCLFAADAALAITGVDHAGPLRGYRGRRQAHAILKQAGGIAQLVTDRLGRGPIEAAQAQRGDVLLAYLSNGAPALGICLGRLIAFPSSEGLAFHPLTVAHCAWRIG